MKYSVQSPDDDLIKGCLKKHRLAQKYLYQKYYGRLLGIGMRYTGHKEEAIDVLNRAFLKIFKNLKHYKPSGSFSGWMAKIVWNTAIDYVRSQAKYRKVMRYEITYDKAISMKVMDELIAEDLYKKIQQLPLASRSVFSLYVIDGYKHREIADLLNISIGTSKWHLADAKRKLRVLLKDYDKIPLNDAT